MNKEVEISYFYIFLNVGFLGLLCVASPGYEKPHISGLPTRVFLYVIIFVVMSFEFF